MKILITGATGNVGSEVINALIKTPNSFEIYAGVRDLLEDSKRFTSTSIKFVKFDFTDPKTYQQALPDCDILFLLRPPQISEVEKYFKPIIEKCRENKVQHIVFLSVQGVENSSIIPHFKIEKLIRESKIDYTFLRPAYFMQNFTTTLYDDLVKNKLIFLPAGKSKFTIIDVRDIGEVAAQILINMELHKNKSYELTNNEKLSFLEMSQILSSKLGTDITYESPNLMKFFLKKRRENVPTMLILVMIMLHYLPRFQKEPETTNWVKTITHKEPITFSQFVIENKDKLMGKK